MKVPPRFRIPTASIKMPAGKDCFTELPDELMLEILKYLGPLEQAALQRVNSRMMKFIPKPVLLHFFEIDRQNPGGRHYKRELVDIQVLVYGPAIESKDD
jgi:hypothetical protein